MKRRKASAEQSADRQRLLPASEAGARFFDPAWQPDIRTWKSWIEKKYIRGMIIGKNILVDVSSFEPDETSTGNELADKILRRRGKTENA